MASTYGFRAYVVEAYPNMFKDNKPLLSHSSSNVRTRIVSLLEAVHSMSTQEFKPKESTDGEPRQPTATLTVGDPAILRDDFIHLVVEAGIVGSHTHATKIGETPQKLSDRSAEAAHMFAFLFSQRDDSKFVVIAQTINGRDPMRRLISLLHRTGIELRNHKLAQDKAERAAAREAKMTVPKVNKRVRLAFKWRQASDSQYLQEILGSAKSVSAVFKGHRSSSRGGADVISRTLTISLRETQQNEAGGTIAKLWERRQRAGETITKGDGVSELAAVLEQQELVYEGEADHYDDASLRVVAENGARATIAVDSLREIFTYPVHEGSPSPWYFYTKVSERLPAIAREADVQIANINPTEVMDWLAD